MTSFSLTRACLFDLDGTLVDSIALIVDAFHHALWERKRQRVPSEVWIAGIGTPLSEQLRPFCESETQLERMRSVYAEYYIAHHDHRVALFDGASDAVWGLRQRGVALGIVTSKSRVGALRTLTHCGLTAAFDIIVSADDVRRGKPDPEPVVQALLGLSVAPGEAVFVGDSPHDIEAGRAAGVCTAAALWGPFPQDVVMACRPHVALRRPHEIHNLCSPAARDDAASG